MLNASGKVTNAQFLNLEIVVRKPSNAEQSEIISKSMFLIEFVACSINEAFTFCKNFRSLQSLDPSSKYWEEEGGEWDLFDLFQKLL